MTGAKRKLADRWKHRSAPVAREVLTACIEHEPQIDYALVLRERIKQLGDDGLKEEPRLRAFEAVVGLYLANHPGVSIDEAKPAVLALLKA
jgi:hypothetical protein